MTKYKKYTAQAKAAIKGEAFFESLVSDYSIPHHITGPTDIGIDYICEWVYGDKPSGILYAVQVKTLSKKYAKLESLGINSGFNELNKFNIRNRHLLIDEKTLEYWRGLGIPVYLFAVIYSDAAGHGERLDCYYKRFVRVLTTSRGQEDEYFYKVNDGTTFLAFADRESKRFGFVRDLFIDLMRCSYYKGSISYISPRTIGLNQFPEEGAIFGELFEEYRKNITKTIEQTRNYIEQIINGEAIPSAAPPEDE
jgi:hypothetical protein